MGLRGKTLDAVALSWRLLEMTSLAFPELACIPRAVNHRSKTGAMSVESTIFSFLMETTYTRVSLARFLRRVSPTPSNNVKLIPSRAGEPNTHRHALGVTRHVEVYDLLVDAEASEWMNSFGRYFEIEQRKRFPLTGTPWQVRWSMDMYVSALREAVEQEY